MKGLWVDVYRAADRIDCSNGGLTARFDRVLLLPGEDSIAGKATALLDGYAGANEGDPVLYLHRRMIAGREQFYATPFPTQHGPEWVMFGGNFVCTSDSRFASLTGGDPVGVHDRIE